MHYGGLLQRSFVPGCRQICPPTLLNFYRQHERVRCNKQSALSMLEMGRMTALSHETLRKIAEILDISLPESDVGKGVAEGHSNGGISVSSRSICPNPFCLSNHPYFIGEELFFSANGMAGNGHHCALCGEVMLSRCPHCGSAIRQAGGCCSVCGEPFVAMPDGMLENAREWVQTHRAEIEQLRSAHAGNVRQAENRVSPIC